MREAERCFNCGICNQCDNCRLFCPDLAIIRDIDRPPAAPQPQGRWIDYDYCKGCGICVVECPRNAMTLEEGGEVGPPRLAERRDCPAVGPPADLPTQTSGGGRERENL